MKNMVLLVDEEDNVIGEEEKIKAHQNGGKLHRAFSILIYNDKGEMMLQKRAKSKYHFGGLWTNACCSHPKPGEPINQTIHSKLMQEMGFDTELNEVFSFIYKADFDNGLTEYEFDHVFVGKYDREPKINPEEADDWKWIGMEKLNQDVLENPEKYTPWFKIILEKIKYGILC